MSERSDHHIKRAHFGDVSGDNFSGAKIVSEALINNAPRCSRRNIVIRPMHRARLAEGLRPEADAQREQQQECAHPGVTKKAWRLGD